ncbi:MAG: HesA/MoeB/ThiF family protein [Heliobacteriaceae bacterium]|jgi:adenylyltransferase/sulfurtransferase|nr:HesA/MoeB/ThiF family protein [Heliobacteriaceae bacterium]
MERYIRNTIIPKIGEAGQEKIRRAKALICGAGGLGSTVIANMSAVGTGTIGIVDNDALELSNLNRQYIHKFENLGKVKVNSAKDWINAFNPEINVKTYQTRLDHTNYAGIVKDYDFIIDCFDSFNSKFLLNDIAVQTGKTLIHGGVTEFGGQVMTIFPGKTACLRCILPDADENLQVLKGVVSPAVATIASIESMEALKLILNLGAPLANRLLCFNGLEMTFRKLNIERNAKCPLCKNI